MRQPDHIKTLQDALKHLTKLEVIEDFHRGAGTGKADATNQTTIETLPPVLILHLKRFQFDPRIGDTVKITKHVHFDTTLTLSADLFAPGHRPQKPAEYRLFAVINHHGGLAAGGHYTCDVMRGDSSWMRVDDTALSMVSPLDVVAEKPDREPYLLWYENVAYVTRDSTGAGAAAAGPVWTDVKPSGSSSARQAARAAAAAAAAAAVVSQPSVASPPQSQASSASSTPKLGSRKKVSPATTTAAATPETTKHEDAAAAAQRRPAKREVVGATPVNNNNNKSHTRRGVPR